jgi:competence protein ComEC
MASRTLGHRAPLLWLVLPFMAGLAMGKAGEFAPTTLLLAGALVAALAANCAAWRPSRAWAPSICVALFLAGGASYVLHRARLPAWERLPPREARLSLRVDRVFPQKDGRRATGLATVVQAGEPVGELVGQHLYFSLGLRKGESAPARSAIVTAVGLLTPLARNPPADSFDGYLASAGMNFRLGRGRLLNVEQPPTGYYVFLERAAGKLNEWLSAGIATKRPELTAVFRAMMLGQKHELSDEQDALFMQSGTMHLFAINGLHIGVVAIALHALLSAARCPRPVAAVITLGVLWLDVDTTGASPSAVRAFVLVACYEVAVVLRRPANGLASLAAAALIVLLVEPMALFSASFQMSYGVVLAILTFGLPLAERMAERFAVFKDLPEATWAWWQRGLAAGLRWLWPVLGIGFAAALVSTVSGPAFFQVWAPGGLITNLVLVPLAMFVIIAGFASVVAGLAGLTLAGVLFNHAAIVLLAVIDFLIRLGVRAPGAWWAASWRAPWMAGLTLALLLAALLAGYASGWRRERGAWWPPLAIALLGLMLGVKFSP